MNSPTNTKHLYNIFITWTQRLRRWPNIAQMLYKCFVFAGWTGVCRSHQSEGATFTMCLIQNATSEAPLLMQKMKTGVCNALNPLFIRIQILAVTRLAWVALVPCLAAACPCNVFAAMVSGLLAVRRSRKDHLRSLLTIPAVFSAPIPQQENNFLSTPFHYERTQPVLPTELACMSCSQ